MALVKVCSDKHLKIYIMRLSTIILTGVLATAFTSASFAQTEVVEVAPVAVAEVQAVEEAQTIAPEDGAHQPKEIKTSELPSAVQQTLKTDLYKGWHAKRAWKVEKDGKDLYKVEVENNDKKVQNLLFDENGIAID